MANSKAVLFTIVVSLVGVVVLYEVFWSHQNLMLQGLFVETDNESGIGKRGLNCAHMNSCDSNGNKSKIVLPGNKVSVPFISKKNVYIDGKPENGWWDRGTIIRPLRPSTSSSNTRLPTQRLTTHEPYLPFNILSFFFDAKKYKENPSKKKLILWYIPSRYTPDMPRPEPLVFCPEYPCRVTTNTTYFKDSDMVVFNGQLIQNKKPPERAFPDQVYLWHVQEAPAYYYNSAHRNQYWRGIFNWTMMYRSDSDLPAYFGDIRKHPDPPQKDYRKILSRKKKKVVWLVSHCKTSSKRNEYVKELQKYIQVDVYGACGKLKCARENDENCQRDLSMEYKFFLGFENAICPDYITEKFFRSMPYDIVVVARAGGGFENFASPDTFINTANFSSPKHLAEHLLYLDKNDEAYMNILKRKDEYIYLFEDQPQRNADGSIKFMHYQYDSLSFCQACKKLWNLDQNRNAIPDMRWWIDKKKCRAPDDF